VLPLLACGWGAALQRRVRGARQAACVCARGAAAGARLVWLCQCFCYHGSM